MDEEMEEAEDMDPSVPSELLEIYVALDEAGISEDEFREAYSE